MTGVIILAVLGLFAVAVLTAIVTVIYVILYNRHINSGKGKKWISPLSVTLITFLVTSVLALGGITAAGFLAYKPTEQNYSVAIDMDCFEAFLPSEEFETSEYTTFNGGEVSGYKLEDKSKGDFECQLYTKTDSTLTDKPDYFVIVNYKGKKQHNLAYAETIIDTRYNGTGQGIELAMDNSDKYYAAINNDDIRFTDEKGNEKDVPYDLLFILNLYNIDYDATPVSYSSGDYIEQFKLKLN